MISHKYTMNSHKYTMNSHKLPSFMAPKTPKIAFNHRSSAECATASPHEANNPSEATIAKRRSYVADRIQGIGQSFLFF